jgi:hypothetical protein
MVAPKQQFLLVHCAVVVCSDDDIGTSALSRAAQTGRWFVESNSLALDEERK